jgi:hypothetical protein
MILGNLPSSIAQAPNLEKLHLSRNLLSGSIPSSYYQMQNLNELYIDSNNIGGSLSQVDEPLYFTIRDFAIHNNTFEGRFPAGQFGKTEILSKISFLLDIILHFTCFLITVSYVILFRSRLTDVLTLHDNKLTGMITDSICQRLNESNPNDRLTELSVDCDLVQCTCCTCY